MADRKKSRKISSSSRSSSPPRSPVQERRRKKVEDVEDVESTKDKLRVMNFFWNAEELRVCETSSQKEADKSRSSSWFINRRKPCSAPDFMENIRGYLDKFPDSDENSIDIISISTVEKTSESYLHTEYLEPAMNELGYSLFKYYYTNNIGDGSNSIRLSIFMKEILVDSFALESNTRFYFFGNDGSFDFKCKREGRNSGFIAVNIGHPYYGVVSFVVVSLPDHKSVEMEMTYKLYKTYIKNINNLCLYEMTEKIIKEISNEFKTLHLFIMGDFNYVIDTDEELLTAIKNDMSNSLIKNFISRDQLAEIKDVIFNGEMKEGVNDEGPAFVPTWALKKGRGRDCQVGDTLSDQNVKSLKPKCYSDVQKIGWKSRMLYNSSEDSAYVINCIHYNSFDVGKIRDSPNSALIGIYDIYYPGM